MELASQIVTIAFKLNIRKFGPDYFDAILTGRPFKCHFFNYFDIELA